jgi:hypothetical protein
LLRLLPKPVQEQAREAYRLFARDPAHPGLHLKKVGDNPTVVSVRILRGYRALGVREADSIVWFWIGSHTDYDRRLRS